ETALEQLGGRYPYPYEFLKALALDPRNIALRRELAFLYLAMGKTPDAVAQLKEILGIDSSDQLSREQLEALTSNKKAAVAPPPVASVPDTPTVVHASGPVD